MGNRAAKAALFEEFARVGKALANGKRLELLDLLAQGERSVEALAAAAGLGLSTASAHLQTLRQAGLVTTRREGTKIYYDTAGDDVMRLFELVRSVAQERVPAVENRRVAYLRLDGPRAEQEELTRDELAARAAEGRVTILDVRPTDEYVAGHIPGALSIPLDELEARVHELPAGGEVVAYCRGAYCVMAYDALDILRAQGLKARRLEEGMLEWRLAGLPVTPPAETVGTGSRR
ncbi:metalloregulator ArsR/SmtB family transcription factor [Sinomonas sp. JGH33]|uniref:Metalloregulator ArsR/SmtB family transcription factor n=1 Tax=Sinomonas terricola TaxID=3110330 RepID=A0ABU5T2K1_9MICC|nr:metalloregulator ArsR/SmtB family transcription factor [Sinomonas sp. JGH33]MEA5453762.1 metalloregulator ArsR/SmtB family transcription factor [Sinomonas sp. JGH33]